MLISGLPTITKSNSVFFYKFIIALRFNGIILQTQENMLHKIAITDKQISIGKHYLHPKNQETIYIKKWKQDTNISNLL